MGRIQDGFYKLSRILDHIAGIFLFLVMMLVVFNVLLRSIFNAPITATYDLVGMFTSVGIGLSLAYCAIQKGHIAIDYFIDKFPPGFRLFLDFCTHFISIIFLVIASWQLTKLGYNMTITGEKSASAMIPYYPFIYIVAFGMFIFSIIVLLQMVEIIKRVTQNE